MRLSIQHDLRAGGQERKALFDLALKARPRGARDGAVTGVEPELRVLMTDEVDRREHWLVLSSAKAATKLLQEDGRALGGSEEKDGVDCRNVDSFIEHVDSEDGVDVSSGQPGQGICAVMGSGSARDRQGGDPRVVENARHVLGVSNGDAETESPHRLNIRDLVIHLLQHDARASIVARVDVGKRVLVIRSTAPLQVAEVDAIGHSEVVEGAEQVGTQRIPEAKFRCDSTAKERPDIGAVSPFWCRGQPEQLFRVQVVSDPAVCRGLRVVELVDYDHFEGIRRDVGDAIRSQ